MSQKKSKATRRSISVLKQIVTGALPGWKIAEFAANEKIKAREFSYDAQIHLLKIKTATNFSFVAAQGILLMGW